MIHVIPHSNPSFSLTIVHTYTLTHVHTYTHVHTHTRIAVLPSVVPYLAYGHQLLEPNAGIDFSVSDLDLLDLYDTHPPHSVLPPLRTPRMHLKGRGREGEREGGEVGAS